MVPPRTPAVRPPWWSRALTYWGFDAVAVERRLARRGRTVLAAGAAAGLVAAALVGTVVVRQWQDDEGGGRDRVQADASGGETSAAASSADPTTPAASPSSGPPAPAPDTTTPAAPAEPSTSRAVPAPVAATSAAVPLPADGPPSGPPPPAPAVPAPATPTTASSPPAPVVLEAEDGTQGGGGRVQSASTASGGEVVGNLNEAGAYAEVVYRGTAAGTGTVAVRYSNANSDARSLSLYVDGTRVSRLAFAPTGGWDSFAQVEVTVPLQAGTNTLRLVRDPDDAPAADVDRLTVTPAG